MMANIDRTKLHSRIRSCRRTLLPPSYDEPRPSLKGSDDGLHGGRDWTSNGREEVGVDANVESRGRGVCGAGTDSLMDVMESSSTIIRSEVTGRCLPTPRPGSRDELSHQLASPTA